MTPPVRKEHDFLGEKEIPGDVYYGVQTLRALEVLGREKGLVDKEKLDRIFSLENLMRPRFFRK